MIKTLKNIAILFVVSFFVSFQALAGSLYGCQMTANGSRVCGLEEKLATESFASNIFSFWDS